MPIALDLDMALRRLETDYRYGRAFVLHPFERTIIGQSRASWFAGIEERLRSGAYRPAPAAHTNIPKGAGGVRPAALLTYEDQVVYTALVGAALPAMQPPLQWAAPPKDFAYQLRAPTTVEWVSAPFRCWEQFRARSVALVDAGAAMVVSTDITGFYGHVDHEILISDLRAAGVEAEICSLLAACISRWCCLNGRGLPQNMTASHLLAKLYLSRVDHALVDQGFEHVRYVDDIRVFCRSKSQAKRALLALAVLLRDRGLTLQSAKTHMLLPAVARSQFEGIIPILKPLIAQFVKDIAVQAGVDAEYMTVSEAEQLVAEGSAHVPAAMLTAAYDAHFVNGSGGFDRTMFHFLIARLGRARDPFALDHALSLLDPHPEETDYILAYIAAIGAVTSADPRILAYLASDGAIYDYQAYQFLRWRTFQPAPASDEVVAFARRIAAADNTPTYLRAAARGLLGRFGTDADLDDLIRKYGGAASDLERAELVCAIARVERGRRNAFLGRLHGDGFLTAGAVAGVRANVEWYSA